MSSPDELEPMPKVPGPLVEVPSGSFPAFSGLGKHDPVQRIPDHGQLRSVNGIQVEPGTPLAYLMDLMTKEADADMSPEQRLYHERIRLEAAKAALPAIHPRLAQVELNGRMAVSHEDALDALERGD